MKRSELFFDFILVPVDVAMIIAAFVFSFYLRRGLEVAPPIFQDFGLRDYLHYSIYLIPVWIALLALNGLYNIKIGRSFWSEVLKIFNASSIAILFLIVTIFLTKSLFFSRLILVFTWILSLVALTAGRLIVRTVQGYLLKFGIGRRNVILIGDNSTSLNIVEHISKKQRLGYKICGVLNVESQASKHGLKILGAVSILKEKIIHYSVDEVILTDTSIPKSKIMDIIQICSDHNVVFKYIPDTFSLVTLNVSPELIGSMPVMELKPIPLDGWGRIIKRGIDFIFSLVFLLILSPLFLIIALLEKITSPGPVFYSHIRVGRDQQFKCYKFRSMYTEKCDFSRGGSKWTTAQDDAKRITSLGQILRKTYLDEIPQFWNILRGDMSFVGPRPEQPKLVKKFENEIPEYFKRHRVKSGLTGWAQVNGLKGDSSIKERVRHDIFYIENWSLWFDIKIIFKTLILAIDEAVNGKYEYRPRS